MTEIGLLMLSWWGTAWLHGLLLLLAVYAAERSGLIRSPSVRELAWRMALLAPLLTAGVQMLAVEQPWAGRHLLNPAPQPAQMLPNATAGWHLAPSDQPIVLVSPRQRDIAGWSPSAGLTTRFGPAGLSVLGWLWTLVSLGLGTALLLACRRERARMAALLDIKHAQLRAETVALAQMRGFTRHPVRLVHDPLMGSPAASAPATICLPTWAIAELAPSQRRAMLSHELAHLARRDPQWLLAYALVARILPLPLASTARARLAELAEFACDAWAAQQSGGAACTG